MNSHVARIEDLQAESFLRIREVAKRTSLSASTIYREVEKGGGQTLPVNHQYGRLEGIRDTLMDG